MLLIRSQVYNLLMYLMLAYVGIRYFIPATKAPEGAYRAIRGFDKMNRWALWHICRIKVELRGEIPEGNCIVCAKHMSFLDVAVIASVLPRSRFILKAELKYVPVIGYYAKCIGSAPVKRGKGGAAVKEMISSLDTGGNENAQTVIFPQGTRVLPDSDVPYKRGAAALYQHYQQPAYMVATNVGVLWARRSAYRYPGTAVYEFLDERIEEGLPNKEFLERISTAIETRSNELMQEYPRGFRSET